jgi:hypothetical protein
MGFFNPVPLGTMGNFVMRKELSDAVTNLSRRDFLKKSAGIAGGSAAASIPGSKLLQKFAPEERALAKEAAIESAPKYKYNSLKEYLDDVQMWAKEDFQAAELSGQGARYSKDEFAKRILLQDEAKYRSAKDMFKPGGTRDPAVYNIPEGYKSVYKSLDDFSPQAKKEMKEFKTRLRGLFDQEPFPVGHPEYQWSQDILNKEVGAKWPNFIDDYVNGAGKKYF